MKIKELLPDGQITIDSYLKACGVSDADMYLNPDKSIIEPPENYDNMNEAFEMIMKCIGENKND